MRQSIRISLRRRTGVPGEISTWIGRHQRELSDRVHAAGDGRARQHGLEITTSTGRYGFGTRSYRDPRFEDRRRRLSAGAARADERDPSQASHKKAGVEL